MSLDLTENLDLLDATALRAVRDALRPSPMPFDRRVVLELLGYCVAMPNEPTHDLNTATEVIRAGGGLCGPKSYLFAVLCSRWSLHARRIHFSDLGSPWNTHVACEVEIDGGWWFLDPTTGVFWTDALMPARRLCFQDCSSSTRSARNCYTMTGNPASGERNTRPTRVPIPWKVLDDRYDCDFLAAYERIFTAPYKIDEPIELPR